MVNRGGGYGREFVQKIVFANYLPTFWKAFCKSLTRISLGKINRSLIRSARLSFVNWRVNCITIHANFSRNLKPLKKWLATSVNNLPVLWSP